jgi:hypothetical protein
MKRAFALLALAACAHGHAEAREPEERHPCDPNGADVAQYQEPAELDDALFPDELALRGKCDEERSSRDTTRNPQEVSINLARQVLSNRRTCDGVCEPMRSSLAPLDDKHDLEDETLQRECTTAVGKLDERVRAGCRHVCLVDRRRLASKALFARVMGGLFWFEAKLPGKAAGDAEVRAMWTSESLPLPPRRVRLAITSGKENTMTAEGAFFPGGPPMRLRLVYGDAGCGLYQWTVDAW